MTEKAERLIPAVALSLVFCAVVYFFVYLQFISPVLYEVDGYYHVAVSNLIKASGPHYDFPWTQFSVFKYMYSDKDFLFHLSIVPFLYLSKDLVMAGKFALVFYNILFFLSFIFILRKYLPDILVAFFLMLPILSSTFTIYSLWLRPAVLANILTIFCIYFLIKKRFLWAFIISLLYSLAHISFFMVIAFAFICEAVRFVFYKETCAKNLWAVVLGSLAGCLMHPNFPNNLVSIYLNAVLTPYYASTKQGFDFGVELYSSSAKSLFFDNFNVFLSLAIIFYSLLFRRVKASFPTIVWWSCASVYFALSFISDRNFYQTNVLLFIFMASFTGDWLKGRPWPQAWPALSLFIGCYAVAASLFFTLNMRTVENTVTRDASRNMAYEDTARWMARNIPAGETIYHASWSDSPYFMCLNPKNTYINCLDPIYMYYPYPKVYKVYQDLKSGRVKNPHRLIKELFGASYGFVRRGLGLYSFVKNDPKNFKILYENNWGLIFKILN